MDNYRLIRHGRSVGFVCPKCETISYNETHIAQRFCSRCHKYFDGDPGAELGPDDMMKNGKPPL
jgi:hypothetical protein